MDLVNFNDSSSFASYRSFKLKGEEDKYELVLGTFLGGSAGEEGVSGWRSALHHLKGQPEGRWAKATFIASGFWAALGLKQTPV